MDCPVEQYARSVLSGETVAGRLVRMACQRHLNDLEHGAERGLDWDPKAVQRVLDFFSYLKLPGGDAPFTLLPWQVFVCGSLFGWKGADGYRRFRTAYIETAKGSGKTPLAAALGLYGICADGEALAECYCAACTREQAAIAFNDGKNIAEASESLRGHLEVSKYNVLHPKSGSYFRAVSSEHRGLDGKRVHMGLIDEIHEHPDGMVVDKIRAGTKHRKQPLIFEITNAGHDRESICWRHREYSEKILAGLVEDDSWFAYVCALDPCEKCALEGQIQPVEGCPDCDDWHDEALWAKVNPGVEYEIPPKKYLRERVKAADGMPAEANIVRRLNFCIWTETDERVIPMDRWDACRRDVDMEALKKRSCYGGLDIGATSDFTAFVLIFPHDDEEAVEVPINPLKPDGDTRTVYRRSHTLVPYFWLCEQPVQRDARMQNIISQWRDNGFIRTTSGNVVDYDQVLEEIIAITKDYYLEMIGFDRGFQGSQMGTNLMMHFGDEVVKQYPQGVVSMNAPFREFLELIKLGRLYNDGNPVMRWMASNCAKDERQGLIRPSKDTSAEKIDGVTAAVMALGVAISDEFGGSIYKTKGML